MSKTGEIFIDVVLYLEHFAVILVIFIILCSNVGKEFTCIFKWKGQDTKLFGWLDITCIKINAHDRTAEYWKDMGKPG